jgi:hypothetical protein
MTTSATQMPPIVPRPEGGTWSGSSQEVLVEPQSWNDTGAAAGPLSVGR